MQKMCKNVGKLQLTFNFILCRRMMSMLRDSKFLTSSVLPPHSFTRREACNDRVNGLVKTLNDVKWLNFDKHMELIVDTKLLRIEDPTDEVYWIAKGERGIVESGKNIFSTPGTCVDLIALFIITICLMEWKKCWWNEIKKMFNYIAKHRGRRRETMRCEKSFKGLSSSDKIDSKSCVNENEQDPSSYLTLFNDLSYLLSQRLN